ncbi:hypothetical protein [Miniphocaeibacter massiliensis]|uniref:hypothetical protein n=1 Tax=Miniphocaeibacter massiliensis TaxID=2041841 RepID=UPI000C1C7BC3|nr:hypothetical protein [Miniphocaeibacter massiliensis]
MIDKIKMNNLDSKIIDYINEQGMTAEQVSATLSSIMLKVMQLPENKEACEYMGINTKHITTKDTGVMLIHWTEKYIKGV